MLVLNLNIQFTTCWYIREIFTFYHLTLEFQLNWYYHLTIPTCRATCNSADDKLVIFFLLFPWNGGDLHEVPKPIKIFHCLLKFLTSTQSIRSGKQMYRPVIVFTVSIPSYHTYCMLKLEENHLTICSCVWKQQEMANIVEFDHSLHFAASDLGIHCYSALSVRILKTDMVYQICFYHSRLQVCLCIFFCIFFFISIFSSLADSFDISESRLLENICWKRSKTPKQRKILQIKQMECFNVIVWTECNIWLHNFISSILSLLLLGPVVRN